MRDLRSMVPPTVAPALLIGLLAWCGVSHARRGYDCYPENGVQRMVLEGVTVVDARGTPVSDADASAEAARWVPSYDGYEGEIIIAPGLDFALLQDGTEVTFVYQDPPDP